MESSNVLRVSSTMLLLSCHSDCKVGGLLSRCSSDLKTDSHVLKSGIWGRLNHPGIGIVITPSVVQSVVVVLRCRAVSKFDMPVELGW